MRSTEVGPWPPEPDPAPDVLPGLCGHSLRMAKLLLVWSNKTSLGMNYAVEQRL